MYKCAKEFCPESKQGGGGNTPRRNSATYIFQNVIYAKKFPKTYISGLVVHAAADGVALGAAATTNQGARSQFKYYSS